MKKIKHDKYRNVTAIIGSYKVQFDAEGNAEVTDETAESIRSIPGFTVLPAPVAVQKPPVDQPAEPVPATETEADQEKQPSTDTSEVVRQPAVETEAKKNKGGRPKKNQ
jgi:hypothetical protein